MVYRGQPSNAQAKLAFLDGGSCQVELIQPLGVYLRGGQTLAVYWTPGDTAYTLEVC